MVPGIGVLLIGVWIAAFAAALLAVVLAVQNAVTCLLYVAGRPGNDDRITRDDWLARRAEEAPPAAAPAAPAGAEAP